MQRTTKVLPLGLIVEGRLVVVVGGGEVGARKAIELAEAGARVRVVSRSFAQALDAPDRSIERVERAFEDADLDGAWLVFAATNDAPTQRRVRDACDQRQVFCVAVDDVANATAWGLARVDRGALLIAISTHGTAPALSRLLREILEQVLPGEPTLEAIQALRAEWKTEALPMGQRFSSLVKKLADGTLEKR